MADFHMRQLRRDAAATGDTDAAARLLRERIRTGLIEEQRVQQAAYLGDEAARIVLGRCPACAPMRGNCRYIGYCRACGESFEAKTRRGDWFRDWTTGLANVGATSEEVECERCMETGSRLGHRPLRLCNRCQGTSKVACSVPDLEFLVRCAVAASRCALGAWEENWIPHDTDHGEGCPERHGGVCPNPGEWCPDDRESPRFLAPSRAIEAVEAWLECQCEEHRKACAVVLEQLADAGIATQLVSQPWSPLLAAVCYGQIEKEAPRISIQADAQLTSPEAVREAIREHVVPWCLS